jgi:hypothetical protein
MVVRPLGERADLGGSPGIHRGEIVVYRASVEAVFLRSVLPEAKIQDAAGF